MTPLRTPIIGLCMAAALSGCNTPRPEANVCKNLARPHDLSAVIGDSPREAEEILIDSIAGSIAAGVIQRYEALRTLDQAPDEVRLQYLALSSGGQWGAFGAGFLDGWTDNYAEPRPRFFDVVTGVSTGAIIAPFAFAGSKYDASLRQEFGKGISNDDVFRSRSIDLLWKPSLASTDPLRRQLEQQVSDQLYQDLRSSSTRGGRLFVGAVDVDSAQFHVLDLSKQSVSNDTVKQGKDCVIDAMLASAAIPIVFTPVYLDAGYDYTNVGGDEYDFGLYVDGGARVHIFFPAIEQAVQRLQLDPRLDGTPVAVDAYMVVNGDVHVPSREIAHSLIGVGLRTATVVIDEGLRKSIIVAANFAKVREDWNLRGIAATSKTIGDPPEGCIESGNDDQFLACFNRWLFVQGEQLGRQGDGGPIPWLDAEGLIRLATAS